MHQFAPRFQEREHSTSAVVLTEHLRGGLLETVMMAGGLTESQHKTRSLGSLDLFPVNLGDFLKQDIPLPNLIFDHLDLLSHVSIRGQ
jgi:hypothetical protein